MLFAESSWYVSREVDDFGDPTGRFSVRIDGLSGTYKNSLSSNGDLKYDIEIKDDGSLYITLLEGGSAKNLTTTSSGPSYVNTKEKFSIKIKYSNGEVKPFTGTLTKDGKYKYDVLFVSKESNDFRIDFAMEKELKVAITGTNGTYSLGTVDTSGIEGEMFFDRSLYDEGLILMDKGQYQNAIDKFNSLKTKNPDSFDFYEAEKSIRKCQTEIVKQGVNEAKDLMNSHDYEKAFMRLVALEDLVYSDLFDSLGATKLKIEAKEKAGVYEIGDTGPAGGLIFYDKGYYSDGWRYLEAAPGQLKLTSYRRLTVDEYVNEYGVSEEFAFGYSDTFVNGTTTYNLNNCTRTAVGEGKNNTRLLIANMGKVAAEGPDKYDGSTSFYAAKCCDDLVVSVDGVDYDDWFLPSKDELNMMYTNLKKKNMLGSFRADNSGFYSYYYWSSSEYSDDPTKVWVQKFNSKGTQDTRGRKTLGLGDYVRPVRAF